MAQTKNTLRNAVDTHASADFPSTNRADSKRLRVESGNAFGYVFFNRPFPLGATIISATLRVYTSGSWGITPTLTVRRLQEHWGVNHLTWNNRPATFSTGYPTTKSSAADQDEWAFDLTAMLQNVADGALWYGVRIETTSTSSTKYLRSSNAADGKPVLEVTWSSAPQAPTTLTPSGSQAVSIAKPILRFDFTDNRGSTALQAVQVQIDAGGNFTSPAFDSGTVLATEPELDLSTTAYAGLTAGQETRWRVRVQDGAGLWSTWSDVVRFRRDNKGTLTIDNPPVSGVISEWTPPIIWSLTGETQTAWRVLITPADDPITELYDTGWTKGADTSWTLPKAIIEDDSDYRAVVQVRDTKFADRVSTPNDPPRTEAVRVFHFNEDPTPNPVTALTITNLLPRAWMQLQWSRSTAPDSFAVKRDGKVIESGIDPADVLVSGTTYRWTDRDASPHRTHDWVVQAVVNAKTSTGNPSISADPDTYGVWLADNDRDIDVLITAGKDPASGFTMGEEGTTHLPVGADQGVRITQSLRGWEGTVTGRLVDIGGKTANEWEDRFLDLKGRPGRVLALTIGQRSFRCVAFSMVTRHGDLPGTKSVSFEFIQVGRLPFDVRW